MASKRLYLSGATKRKQREARLENEAKTRRTLEDLNWCISTPKTNETDSELHKVSGDPESETSNISDLSDMSATPTTSKSLTENEESPTDQQISNMDNNKCRSWQQSEEQNGKNSVDIVTNPSATENTECISNISVKPRTLVAQNRLPYQ